MAVLFFRESCPYCRDFKPTWNRVAKEMKHRWDRGSVVYDGPGDATGTPDPNAIVGPPEIVKLDVTKFPAVKNTIRFPTVPCISLYKRDAPVLFYTGTDRSLPTVLTVLEDYYKRHKKPPTGTYVIGDDLGNYPATTTNQMAAVDEQQQFPPVGRIETAPVPRRRLQESLTPLRRVETIPRRRVQETIARKPVAQNEKRKKETTMRISPIRIRVSSLRTSKPLRNSVSYQPQLEVSDKQQPTRLPQLGASSKQQLPRTSAPKMEPVDDDAAARFLALLLKRRGDL